VHKKELTLNSAHFYFHRQVLCHSLAFMSVDTSRDSSVGIATACMLDNREVGVRVLLAVRFFSFPRRPNRLWGQPSLISRG
jgi:hypothetical protein